MQSDDRLDMMTLFLRIAETGRLAEASRQLGLSQAVASRRLRRLESLLNVELVRRSTRGLFPTEAGLRFADTARTMLDQWQAAADSLNEDPDRLSGPIRILVPVAIGQNLLAETFAAFGKRHPHVSIVAEHRDDALDLPSLGYDLQVRAGPVLHQSLLVRELWVVERAILAAPEHPPAAHPDVLSRYRAVRLSTFVPAELELTHADGGTALLRHNSVLTTDNLYAVLTAVRNGLGFAVMPLWATQELIDRGELIRLCADWRPPPVVVSLVYPPDRFRSRRLDALLRFLRHELTAEAGLGIAFLDAGGGRRSVRTAPEPVAGTP